MGCKVSRSLPRTASDAVSLLFLFSAILVTFWFEVTTVVPYVHPENGMYAQYVHTLMGVFIVINLMGNLWLLMSTETSARGLVLPSNLGPSWRFCAACEGSSPPRSFHCPTCDRCVLKRDHHCSFAGKCVGYNNFRYFYGLVAHLTLGAGYASILNTFFVWDFLGGLSVYTFFAHCFPLLFWIFGKLPFTLMTWCMISVVDFCGFLFTLGLMVYHGCLLLNNQTNHEKNKGIMAYNLGHWRANVRESLGDKWYLVWVCPWLESKLPRDGVHFPTLKEYHLSSRKSK